MSQSSQSSYVTSSHQASHAVMSTTKKRVHDEMVEQNQKQIAHRKSIDTFGRRTSQYRGVTRLGVVRLKPCFDVTGRYGWNIVAKFRGSNVDIGGDELVRGHYNKETKNCVRACYLYCLKTCIKCLEKEYRALCKV
ncbi:AP2-like ethylene-responsive transcription factor ANT [Arachis hypogaea]|nr:AP2-like ethylene-responsive transcription factor ANT [Arachis hypogaea]